MSEKPAIVLLNLGSPDRPTRGATARFLREFLSDPFVLEMNGLFRALLVNFLIVPFRTAKSAARYRRIWTSEGSPLVVHTVRQRELLAERVGDRADVFCCMRYGEPNILRTMGFLRSEGYNKIIFLPLYPQYHPSTNRSAEFAAHLELMQWDQKPDVRLFRGFHQHPLFIEAWAERLRQQHWEDFEHIVFSYHGVPSKYTEYHQACSDTTDSIARILKIPQNRYSYAYQSRFRKNWLSPDAGQIITERAQKGTRSLLVAAPSFVSDNLETLVEISETYKGLFLRSGGSIFATCESLNESPVWLDCLTSMVNEQI